MTGAIAARGRETGGNTIRSIGHIARQRRIFANDVEYVGAGFMLAELREDNKQLIKIMREAHDLCSGHNDVTTL